jgi:Na+-transporting methylmalonyl-CoA/oxaloacetate decarboxylase gamma subunit
MKKITKIFLAILLLVPAYRLAAQSQGEMRINEFLVTNTDDYEDDFGHKNGWIELFNSSYATVGLGGCYLTNDPENLKKYVIPKSDNSTYIAPRQYTIFWADNHPTRGTYHLNFTLQESNEIILVGSDGRTIIDRVKIPHNQIDTNISYGRLVDGEGSTDGSNEGWGVMDRTTPKTSNITLEKEPAHVLIKRIDPFGVIMAITAMSVVFFALILLYLSFKYMGKNAIRKAKKKMSLTESSETFNDEEEHSAEQLAAIAMALDLYFRDQEVHDFEYTVLTRNEMPKNYSPWSSKIYTLRETPVKK